MECSSAEGSCLCLTPMSLVYYDYSPYIAYQNETKSVNGLLKGKWLAYEMFCM